MGEAIFYLAPALVLLALLLAGRYPGEETLVRAGRAPARPRFRLTRTRTRLPFGTTRTRRPGAVLGWRLAGRAPPAAAVTTSA